MSDKTSRPRRSAAGRTTEPLLGPGAIAVLFPLHIVINDAGWITSAGHTLKAMTALDLAGERFDALIRIERPRSMTSCAELADRIGEKLALSMPAKDGGRVQLRGVPVPLAGPGGGYFIDLTFGAALSETVQRFELTGYDFKPNDASIDMFFAMQTQQALLEDSNRLAKELSAAKTEAEKMAYLDPVTGLGNRRAVEQWLKEFAIWQDRGAEAAVLHVDLDKFKKVNDTYGHAMGDVVLQRIADVLGAAAGQDDLAVRLGGDEFALWISKAPPPDALEALGRGLVDGMTAPITHGHRTMQVGASIGIVRFDPVEQDGPEDLLKESDIALYEAKRVGNAVATLTPAMLGASRAADRIVRDIEGAILDGRFVPYFQPQIDVSDNSIRGLEVVARWETEDRGVLKPSAFLAPALQATLMADIDRSVRRQAFEAFAGWRGRGMEFGTLSLNITAANLRSPGFAEVLVDETFEFGLPVEDVELELLESILFDRTDELLADRCRSLRKAGFSLALDDFGTGHASLAALIDNDISLLKVDRSFVAGVDWEPALMRITGSILAMARALDIEVLAEGVEQPAEIAALRAHGCELFQGFHFAPPLPAAELERWFADWAGAARTRPA